MGLCDANGFLVILIFASILMITYHISNKNRCPKNTVQYKYIPRTFKEEQDDPTYVSEILGNMFTDPTVWLIGQTGNKKRKINNY